MTIMNNNTKVCLTTFIYGIQYQSYIPFLLFFCYKAYPEYDVVLFLHDKLDEKIKGQIDSLDLKNKITIHENHFYDCPNITPLKSKAFRWILWDDVFLEYDYLYTVDIDMFYIRESIPLHTQHIQHMNYIGLPISNLARKLKYNPFNLSTLATRLKNAGFNSIFKFFYHEKHEIRTTGLHFVDIKRYYSLLTEEYRERFKKDIYTGHFLSYIMASSDEIFLTEILKKIGIEHSKLGFQKNSVNMLDFSNPNRLEFRPHHGIHMGIFRGGQSITSPHPILESNAYTYYLVKFKKEVLNDSKFYQILEDAPDNIKIAFKCLFQYYGINN